MRKLYGLWASATLLVALVLLGSFTTPVRSQSYPLIRMYPTLSLRNFSVPPHDGIQRVPVPGGNGERYFLVPVWVYNEVDTSFNNNGIVPPGNNDGQHFGQHLEPIRSFSFQVWYHNQVMQLDTGHGSPIVMTGPSIVDGSNNAPVTARLDTGLARTFFVTYSDQSTGNINNPFEHVIRIAGASQVPLANNYASRGDTGYSEHNGILLWLRFRTIPSQNVNDILHLDSATFNDHVGDSLINPVGMPRFDYTHGNFGGGIGPFGGTNTGQLEVDITDQPTFELRPLNLIALLDGAGGANDSLMPDMVYDPTVAGGQVTRLLQFDDAVSHTEIDNITVTSDQPWLSVNLNSPGGSQSMFLGWDAIDYTKAFGGTVLNLYLTADPTKVGAPGVYYATVTFQSDGVSNSPLKLKVRFVKLASPNEPNPGGTGIRLNLTNSCSPVCSNTITFGTGPGATDGIDVLYGEDTLSNADVAYWQSIGQCYAYFKPLNTNADPEFQDPNFAGMTRDIRSSNTDTTIIYQVIFNPGNVNCYPEKVCVDPADFPAGARIVMKFTLNGSEQGIDLRNATLDQNGMECVTISDHRIDSFFIEYTPATLANIGTFLKLNSWTLISLPVVPPNEDASVIFPHAVTSPFLYTSQSGWQQPPANLLQFGRGYMVRYGDYIGTDVTVAGVKSYSYSGVAISQGWNTIGGTSSPGSLLDPLTTFTLTPNPGAPPPNLLTTDGVTPWMWEFTPQHGYDQTVFFTPGRGYFIKVDHSGFVNLTTPAPPPGGVAMQPGSSTIKTTPREQLLGELTHVFVQDASDNGQDLYFGQATTTVPEARFEMPANFRSFDARFDANSGNMSYNHASYVMDLHSKAFPVTMKFTNLYGSVQVTDMNGNVLGTADNNGIVTISNSSITQVRIAEKQDGIGSNVPGYSLSINSPNPFPATTVINYSLPQQSVVSLVVYNELGQAVQTLVNSTVDAGPHQAMFDGTHLPSGTYYYTLKAGNFVQTQTMNLQH